MSPGEPARRLCGSYATICLESPAPLPPRSRGLCSNRKDYGRLLIIVLLLHKPLFPGIEFDRDPVAVHKVLLATIFGICVISPSVHSSRRDSPTVWNEIYY